MIKNDKPLFQLNGAAFTRKPVTNHLRQMLVCLGARGRYSGHSSRRGAATSAQDSGPTNDAIQLLGRWYSDACRTYIVTHPAHILGKSRDRHHILPCILQALVAGVVCPRQPVIRGTPQCEENQSLPPQTGGSAKTISSTQNRARFLIPGHGHGGDRRSLNITQRSSLISLLNRAVYLFPPHRDPSPSL